MKEGGTAVSQETVRRYARNLLEMVLSRGNDLPRSYGFEYEFLPDRILARDDMSMLEGFLKSRGYEPVEGVYVRGPRQVVFEPGGQIEYLSPPLRADESSKLNEVMGWIAGMNEDIRRETGIRYIGTDYIPGRHDAPLLLTSPRYAMMHERFRKVDARGLEMMKGTAAIHLHAAITRPEDLGVLYAEFCRMSTSETLGMSAERRSIWDRTDSCRCGLSSAQPGNSPELILECIVEQALNAVELRTGRVFSTLKDKDFSDFLDHLTTMFTDIRVNVKGGTLELRTPDSRPLEEFPRAWNEFVKRCEKAASPHQ